MCGTKRWPRRAGTRKRFDEEGRYNKGGDSWLLNIQLKVQFGINAQWTLISCSELVFSQLKICYLSLQGLLENRQATQHLNFTALK